MDILMKVGTIPSWARERVGALAKAQFHGMPPDRLWSSENAGTCVLTWSTPKEPEILFVIDKYCPHSTTVTDHTGFHCMDCLQPLGPREET